MMMVTLDTIHGYQRKEIIPPSTPVTKMTPKSKSPRNTRLQIVHLDIPILNLGNAREPSTG